MTFAANYFSAGGYGKTFDNETRICAYELLADEGCFDDATLDAFEQKERKGQLQCMSNAQIINAAKAYEEDGLHL